MSIISWCLNLRIFEDIWGCLRMFEDVWGCLRMFEDMWCFDACMETDPGRPASLSSCCQGRKPGTHPLQDPAMHFLTWRYRCPPGRGSSAWVESHVITTCCNLLPYTTWYNNKYYTTWYNTNYTTIHCDFQQCWGIEFCCHLAASCMQN